ncbi:hypothetical protein BC831DRAFT_297776 [Entophlyctis helioformis]|nr:hypothetical protein BC831DRAFT_297776 [Entophlyctis helioformis]
MSVTPSERCFSSYWTTTTCPFAAALSIASVVHPSLRLKWSHWTRSRLPEDAANSKDRSIEHVSVAAHRCCCIPCRSRNAPGSSVLRCHCSRCPLEQQPACPVHGRLADVLAVWTHQTCTQSVPRPHRHGRQTAVPSSSSGNGACLDRQRVNAPDCLSAACLLSARLVVHASQTATTTLLCWTACCMACCMPP